MRFFICEHCGNLITFLHDAKVPVVCCGQKMTELIPGTVDAATEKHIPVVEKDGNNVIVKVGSVPHPMIDSHFIQWVALETNKGCQIQYLEPDTPPVANFSLSNGEEIVNVYEYCNLHGLWKA